MFAVIGDKGSSLGPGAGSGVGSGGVGVLGWPEPGVWGFGIDEGVVVFSVGSLLLP